MAARLERKDLVPPPVTWHLWLDDETEAGHGTSRVEIGQKVFAAGQTIFHEGDLGDEAYVIRSGAVEIFVKGPSGEGVTLAILGQRALFGEMALIDDGPRSATAIAHQDTIAYVIRRADFERPLRGVNPWIRALLLTMARNLRAANRNMLHAAE